MRARQRDTATAPLRYAAVGGLVSPGFSEALPVRVIDGASFHGKTHSSFPPAATRLITAERRVCTVDSRGCPVSALSVPGGRQARDRWRFGSPFRGPSEHGREAGAVLSGKRSLR